MLNIEHMYVAFSKEYYTLNDINLKLNMKIPSITI